MVGEKQNMASMWKKSMKLVDFEEPTSFLDHVYLGCTQRECKRKVITVDAYTREKPHANTVAWFYHMKDMLENAWNKTVN